MRSQLKRPQARFSKNKSKPKQDHTTQLTEDRVNTFLSQPINGPNYGLDLMPDLIESFDVEDSDIDGIPMINPYKLKTANHFTYVIRDDSSSDVEILARRGCSHDSSLSSNKLRSLTPEPLFQNNLFHFPISNAPNSPKSKHSWDTVPMDGLKQLIDDCSDEDDVEFIKEIQNPKNTNSHSNQSRKRGLIDITQNIDLTTDVLPTKRIKLSPNKSAKENIRLKKQNEILQKRVDLFEGQSILQISAMSLDELTKLKATMQKTIILVEEAEKQLIDNTYKCVACMDRPKSISFIDGCSHMAYCDLCEAQLQKKVCPLCQTPYKNVKKINF